MEEKKRPIGLIILGTFNLIILGALSLLTALSPRTWQTIIDSLKEKHVAFNLSGSLLKTAAVLQSVIALIFIVSGTGLLLGKEWARKLTLYFAFFMVIIALLCALFMPALIKEAAMQIIYPGILILYLTRKNIEGYFKKDTNKHELHTNVHE